MSEVLIRAATNDYIHLLGDQNTGHHKFTFLIEGYVLVLELGLGIQL